MSVTPSGNFCRAKTFFLISRRPCGFINLQGRRDNLYKARIKILVNAKGADEFRDLVETEWHQIKKSEIDLPLEERARINAYFASPEFEKTYREKARR